MKIALIGYGKMGKMLEETAQARGHSITVRIDVDNAADFNSSAFAGSDVAIEFTNPHSAVENYLKCFAAHIPVVSGTTGWTERLPEIRSICLQQEQTFFYASNFSLGVNLFFALNRYLAQIMNNFKQYSVTMEEIHHIHKLDAPSGTAISLAEDIIAASDSKTCWTLVNDTAETAPDAIPITALRRDEVPGTHRIEYRSDVDKITIEHEAFSRQGFALGAVMAAEFCANKKGFFGMNDLLHQILKTVK